MRRHREHRTGVGGGLGRTTLRLARPADAGIIAGMSRELIEGGLGWSWRPQRVVAQIHCPETAVLVAEAQRCVIGFAIMHFGTDVAHLNLLAVARARQRLGIGRQLMEWLESSARVAGIQCIRLEVRASNRAGRAFYRTLGYREIAIAPRYYRGREAAIRMERGLRAAAMRDDPASCDPL